MADGGNGDDNMKIVDSFSLIMVDGSSLFLMMIMIMKVMFVIYFSLLPSILVHLHLVSFKSQLTVG
jgi:hypothetical protein